MYVYQQTASGSETTRDINNRTPCLSECVCALKGVFASCFPIFSSICSFTVQIQTLATVFSVGLDVKMNLWLFFHFSQCLSRHIIDVENLPNGPWLHMQWHFFHHLKLYWFDTFTSMSHINNVQCAALAHFDTDLALVFHRLDRLHVARFIHKFWVPDTHWMYWYRHRISFNSMDTPFFIDYIEFNLQLISHNHYVANRYSIM